MNARQDITPAQQIVLWADKLRDVSALGLHFSKNVARIPEAFGVWRGDAQAFFDRYRGTE